ncbi:hypothetical protein BpHYR1_042150 [Brachionus plicatilis]|uniref:Uncharacterized protein n=1 Tax=Brachionus plicatilis TaxID=10195 RepID=A0A3M7PAV6_BRAPC|nr:hypothetical protein BpHYR1_042150 [Brachionus plicatilis]
MGDMTLSAAIIHRNYIFEKKLLLQLVKKLELVCSKPLDDNNNIRIFDCNLLQSFFTPTLHGCNKAPSLISSCGDEY